MLSSVFLWCLPQIMLIAMDAQKPLAVDRGCPSPLCTALETAGIDAG